MTTYQDIYRQSALNLFLQALGEPICESAFSKMELVPLTQGKILLESGVAPRYAYFPTTCVVSLVSGTEYGVTAEIAVIGNEGVVGITSLIGGDISPVQAIVQSTGYAYRVRMSVLRQEFQSNSLLRDRLLNYMQALMLQMAQTAVCNRHHTVDQQLCRWFLHCLDRLPSNELAITQEFIAHMLGVRREGVTAAARKLQKSGIISYRRGRITILDRAALEARSCACYKQVCDEYQRLLTRPAPPQKVANNWSSDTSFKPVYVTRLPVTNDRIGLRA